MVQTMAMLIDQHSDPGIQITTENLAKLNHREATDMVDKNDNESVCNTEVLAITTHMACASGVAEPFAQR
jgi:hypothetical protein